MYLKNQSRKQKKGGVICIAALMLALAFGGCGEKDKKADTTTVTKENETMTEAKEGSSQSESEFDFSQVYDNIELNGKKIPFPFTLNDLGEEYDFNGIYVENEGNIYFTTLLHEDKAIAYVYVNAKDEESINRESLINAFDIYRSHQQEFVVNGINCNSSLIDIENSFLNLSIEYTNQNKNEINGYSARDYNGNLLDIAVDENQITFITVERRNSK